MQAPRFETVLGVFPVRDLAATRDFYVRDLGLEVAQEPGACLVLAAGSGLVGFCQADDGEGGTSEPPATAPVITFVTDAVDAVHERLRRLGVEVEGPPRRHAGDDVHRFYTRDPDGYRVEVRRPHGLPGCPERRAGDAA